MTRFHPLAQNINTICARAMINVKNTMLIQTPLVDALESFKGNTGSLIGTLFEYYIQLELEKLDNTFTPQSTKWDRDIICMHNRQFDFEIKTTSSKSNYIYGNRIIPRSKNDQGGYFVLAVKYDKNSLNLTQIRFGWCEPHQWVAQKGNGQQSRLALSALEQCNA